MKVSVYGAFEGIDIPPGAEERNLSAATEESRSRRNRAFSISAVILIGCIVFIGGSFTQQTGVTESLNLEESSQGTVYAETETKTAALEDYGIPNALFNDAASTSQEQTSQNKAMLDRTYNKKHNAEVLNRKNTVEIKQEKNTETIKSKPDKKSLKSKKTSSTDEKESSTASSDKNDKTDYPTKPSSSSSSSQSSSESVTPKADSSSSSSSQRNSESVIPKKDKSSSQSSRESFSPKSTDDSKNSGDKYTDSHKESKSNEETGGTSEDSNSGSDDSLINRDVDITVTPNTDIESWEESTDSENSGDSEKDIYVLGHHRSKKKWEHTDDEYGGHRDAIGEKETNEMEEADEAEEDTEDETEEIVEELEDDTENSHSKKHSHKNKHNKHSKEASTDDTSEDSEDEDGIFDSNDDSVEDAVNVDQEETDSDVCVNSIDESRGEGACSYFIDHFQTHYGIDACMSLYCTTCDLQGSCDLECGVCVPFISNSTSGEILTDDSELDTTPTTRHSHKSTTDDEYTKIVATGYLNQGNSTNTSVAYSNMQCGDSDALTTADVTDFLVSTGNENGMQTVSLDVCGVRDSVSTEIDIYLYDSCPYSGCKNAGNDITILFKDVLRKSSDCVTVTVTLDADEEQTAWLRLSPKDSNAEDSFELAIVCDSGVAPTAAPGTPPAGWKNSGESAAVVNPTVSPVASPTVSPTTADLIIPHEELICGQSITDSTDGATNFIGFPGPDQAYMLSIAGASSFIVTICPITRSDNALWVFELPGGAANRVTGLGDLRAESGLRSGCTSVEYTVLPEHEEFWVIVDGSKDGSYEMALSCSFVESASQESTDGIVVTDDLTTVVASVFSENEYLAYNDSTLIASDYPWATEENCMIVEPHRNTTFRAEFSKEYMHVKGLQFRWKINNRYYPTRTATATFEEVGKYTVEFEVYDVKVQLEKSIRTVYVRYIRREVRDLTEIDRTKFLNAMKVLYSTTTKDGIKTFGQGFKGMDYLSLKYASLAASSDCDQVSDGLGFLTNHVALIGEMEASLQTIEPHLALPYWDFAIDAHSAYTQKKELHTDIELSDAWRRSSIFDDEFFGSASPNNQYHSSDRGRWGYLAVPSDMWNSTTNGVNAYGYLRAPWNLNDSPYVSRSDHVFEFQESAFSDCSSMFSLLQASTWPEFGSRIEDAMSVPTSVMVAGAWTKVTALEWAEAELGHDAASKLAQISLALSPIFYRANMLTCPDYCSSDSTSSESCECSVETGLSTTAMKKVFASSGAAARFAQLDAHQDFHTVSDDGSVMIESSILRSLWKMVGSSAIKGDMLDSSATLDPLFWVIHPNIERLWQWKRLSSSPYEYSWPSGSSVYSSCSGHDADDIVPFSNLFSIDGDSNENVQYSNSEIYDLLDPTGTNMNYIYGDFGWSYCIEEGYDLRDFDAKTPTGM